MIVVGGGLAGLATAIHGARAGLSVRLFERSASPGGRAATQVREGFYLNEGPHAVYASAKALLEEVGVQVVGGIPRTRAVVVNAERLTALDTSPGSLITTRALTARSKLQMARFFAGVGRVDHAKLDGTTVTEYLDRRFTRPDLRALMGAYARVATYSDAPDEVAAGTLIRAIGSASQGVVYVPRGWQTLVDALVEVARAAGVRMRWGARVEAVRETEAGFTVETAGEGGYVARSVVLAGTPRVAAQLAPPRAQPTVAGWAAAVPARAATLDVALSGLPVPERPFALVVDRPLYYSVHSSVAEFAPEGKALVSLAKYLPADGSSDGEPRAEMEALLDVLQPGWRERVLFTRYLPEMVVNSSLAPASSGGLPGRPGPAVPAVPGLFVAGDWVGTRGWLSEASLVSGREAARLAASQLARAPRRELAVAAAG
jgi:phytoene dehydrogenase-like protein